MAVQGELFTALKTYESGPRDQASFYDAMAAGLNTSLDEAAAIKETPSGRFNVFKRNCRWLQQSLKDKGLIERVSRGVWDLTGKGKEQLSQIKPGYSMVAYCSNLGVALWADAASGAEMLQNDTISLLLTSPPYFRIKRNYGTHHSEQEYIDFLLRSFEPYIPKLKDGAAVVLNIGNDVFEPGRPARSVVTERIVIAFHDQLGLDLVERICWESNKSPGPMYWAFVCKTMLRSGFEHTFVFANDARQANLQWDNRNIRVDHDAEYLKWCEAGGTQKAWANSTYQRTVGSFSGTKQGEKLPTNVLKIGNIDTRKRATMKVSKQHGLPSHTATFPVAFCEFFIKWLTQPGQLVVDIFCGTNNTGHAAQKLGREWFATDITREFHQLAALTDQEFGPYFL